MEEVRKIEVDVMSGRRGEEPSAPVVLWDLVILVISLYSLASIAVLTLAELGSEVETILVTVDYLVCAVFAVDFAYRLFSAPSRLEYLRWGWLDLLSCVPVAPGFRMARLVRVFRIIRVMRGLHSARDLLKCVTGQRQGATLAFASLVGFFVVLFGAILILEVEKGAGGPIRTGGDAIWWAFVTVTTVGYGDMVPVTTAGRVIAVVLMVAGIGVFGSFAAFVASAFLSDAPGEELRSGEVVTMETVSEMAEEIRQMRAENALILERLDRMMGDQKLEEDS